MNESIEINNKLSYEQIVKETRFLSLVQIPISQSLFPRLSPDDAMMEYSKEDQEVGKVYERYSWCFKKALREIYDEGVDIMTDLDKKSENRERIIKLLVSKMIRIREENKKTIKHEDLREAA